MEVGKHCRSRARIPALTWLHPITGGRSVRVNIEYTSSSHAQTSIERTRTCIHAYICTDRQTCIYIHTYIRTHTHIHIYIRIHTYIHIYIHPYIHTYMHAYIHTREYVHTYVHTCMAQVRSCGALSQVSNLTRRIVNCLRQPACAME